MKPSFCLVALAAIVAASSTGAAKIKDWWTHAVFYQLYPLSYKDSNGDGYGDLQGVIDKLDYVKDTGFDGIWLCPIYPTPMADFTYDVKNYTDVDPIFGNLDIFDKFMARAKELGLKILLDFVPDYASDELEWFQKSVKRIDPYTDYFIWDDGIEVDGYRVPINHWQAVFGGPAWTWSIPRQQFYLHAFTYKQPEVNWDNPNVIKDFTAAMRFWLGKGIDGFRVDSCVRLFEGPLDNKDRYAPTNLPQVHDIIKIFRKVTDEKSKETGESKILVLEEDVNTVATMEYYGTPDAPEGQLPLNFRLLHLNRGSKAQDFVNSLNDYISHINEDDFRTPSWLIGNHDVHRPANRFDPKLVDALHFILLLLPGAAFTYMGEEIGMVNSPITWEECLDPQGVNAGPKNYAGMTRDSERTPFQWDSSPNAGFSDAEKTWLPVNPNYKELNLEAQVNAEKSHYKIYKQILQLRKEPTFEDGDTVVEAIAEYVLGFTRSLEGKDTYLIVVNLGFDTVTVNIKEKFATLPDDLTIVALSIHASQEIGSVIDATNFELKAQEGFVLTTKSEAK